MRIRNRVSATRAGKVAAATAVLLATGGFSVLPTTAADVQVSASCDAEDGAGQYVGDEFGANFGEQVKAQLQSLAIPLLLPGTIEATPTIQPGGTVDYTASLNFDPQALATAARQLAVPQIAQQTSQTPEAVDPVLGIEFVLDNLQLTFPAPAGTTFTGTPTAGLTGTNAPSIAASLSGNSLLLDFGKVRAGAYGTDSPDDKKAPPIGPLTITFTVSATADAGAASPIQLKGGPATLDITLLFTLGNADSSLQFGWGDNPATCTPNEAVLAETLIVDANATTTTAPSTAAVTAQPSFTG